MKIEKIWELVCNSLEMGEGLVMTPISWFIDSDESIVWVQPGENCSVGKEHTVCVQL